MVKRVGVPASRSGANAAARVGPGRSRKTARPEPGSGASLATEPARRRTDGSGDGRPRLEPDDGPAQLIAADLLRLDPILLTLAESERHFRTLIEQAADGILMVDGTGRVTLANSRACEMTGYGHDEILGLPLIDTYLPEEREIGRERVQQMPAGTTLRFQRELLRKDGTRTPIDVSVAWLPDGERQSIMRDITARVRGQDLQRAEERRLRALVRLSALENRTLAELLDATLEEVVALSDSVFGYIYYYSEETEEFTLHAWSRGVMESCSIPNPQRSYRLSETGIWGEAVRQRRPIVVNDFAAPDPLKGGYPEGHAPLTRFMTIPVSSRGRIVAVAGVANKATDYTDTDVGQLSQMMDVIWKIAERQRAEDELRSLADELEVRVQERTREFERANAELEAANVEIGATNAELQRILIEQERMQGELAYRALHDPLTELANRTMFQERLDHAFRVSQRGVAVLWIDLDRFKEVNDIYGHDVGDEMLVAVADRLRDVIRETDDIARVGGDEFAVVLPNVVETEAQAVAERVLSALTDKAAFRLQVRASVGVGWQHTATGDGKQLLRLADQAMYKAKASGGGTAAMY
jgi:diguanylate cyclase (GGDEF)-like protein/PAS domain S-box-containing protein